MNGEPNQPGAWMLELDLSGHFGRLGHMDEYVRKMNRVGRHDRLSLPGEPSREESLPQSPETWLAG